MRILKTYILFFCLFFVIIPLSATAQTKKEQSATQTSEDSLPNKSTYIKDLLKGDRFLVLEKQGVVKRLRFFRGQRIRFQLKDEKTVYNPIITAIEDSAMVVSGTTIQLKDISSIIISNESWFIHQGSYYFPIAGAGYFLMDMINPIFSNGEAFVITRGTVITCSALIVSGLLLNLFKKRKHKLGEKKYLRTLLRY